MTKLCNTPQTCVLFNMLPSIFYILHYLSFWFLEVPSTGKGVGGGGGQLTLTAPSTVKTDSV